MDTAYMYMFFILYIKKKDDIYKDIAEDFETRFDTSNYELNRPLTKRNNKKVIGVMKDELGGKTMKEFFGLRTKTYSYLVDDGNEDIKAKSETNAAQEENLSLRIIKAV